MEIFEYFKTPVYLENLSHWVDDINKKCDKHINEAKKENQMLYGWTLHGFTVNYTL